MDFPSFPAHTLLNTRYKYCFLFDRCIEHRRFNISLRTLVVSSFHLTSGEVVYSTEAWSPSPRTEYSSVVSLLQPCHAGSKTRPQRAFVGLLLRFWQALVFNAWMKETTLGLPLGQIRTRSLFSKEIVTQKKSSLKSILLYAKYRSNKSNICITQFSLQILQWCLCSSCLFIAYQRDHKMLN